MQSPPAICPFPKLRGGSERVRLPEPPPLIGLVVYWGKAACDRQLVCKVNTRLITARQHLGRVLEARQLAMAGLVTSARLRGDGGRAPLDAAPAFSAQQQLDEVDPLLRERARPDDRHCESGVRRPVAADRCTGGRPGAELQPRFRRHTQRACP